MPTIHINKKNVQITGNLDSTIESIKFVPLETNDSSLIQEISKMINIGDSILICDYKLGKILLFSQDGNFISMFKNVGKGPGEYIKIKDITFDEIRKEVVLLDIGSRQILRYDLKGRHISSDQVNIANAGVNFEWFNNSFVFFRHNQTFPEHSNHNIIITDQNQQYIKSGAIIPEQISNLSLWGNKNMSKSDSLLYVYPCFNDTIFSINKNLTIKPSILIDIDERLDVKKSKLWDRKMDDIVKFHQELEKTDYIFQTSDFFSLSTNFIFRYFTKKGYSLVVFSINDDSTKIFNNPCFTNDNFSFDPIGKQKNKIIVAMNPSDKINKYLEQPIALDSNPVLCFIELKK
ncbi:hypothetical protein FGL01_28750 [Flavobacterium glycines]|nr:hypothetical protein FGL01_28750 [Flavobacterium glycines]